MRNISGYGGFAALKERYERSQRKKGKGSQKEDEIDQVNNISTEESSQAIAAEEKEDLFLKSLNESIQLRIKEYEEKLSEKENKDINSILRKKIKEDQTDTFIFETKQIISQKVYEEYAENIDPSLKAAHITFTEEASKIKKNIRSETSAETRPRTKSRSNSEIEATLVSEAGFKSWKEENRDIVDKKDEYFRELKLIDGYSNHISRSVKDYYTNVFDNIRQQIQEEEAVTPPVSPRGKVANLASRTEQNNTPFH